MKQTLQKLLCLAFMAFTFITPSMAEASYIPMNTPVSIVSDPSIMPFADVIIYKTRIFNGVNQYRRWNETKKCWVDPDWIDFP